MGAFVIVWRFEIRASERERFERIYGSDGEWAVLFRRSADYLGTELFRDARAPERYLIVDRWKSAESYESFRRAFAAEYAALDERCKPLTIAEERWGAFEAGIPG